MKNRILKILLISAMMILFLILETNAAKLKESEFSLRESPTSSGTSDVSDNIFLNQVMSIENANVKMTQTDDKYTFKITGNATYDVSNNLGNQYMANYSAHLVPLLYKSANFSNNFRIYESDMYPFGSYSSGTITSVASVETATTILAKYYYQYVIYTNGNMSVKEDINENNGDKYFIPATGRSIYSSRTYNFKNAKKYPMFLNNNGVGVNLDSNSSTVSHSVKEFSGENYVQKTTYTIDATITIEKQYIDDYRYVCFGSGYTIYSDYRTSDLSTWVKGYSFSTNTIDLKQYVTCNHNWTVTECNDASHTLKCSLCSWEQKGEHNYEYEYDNIKNIVCVCQKIKKVNFHYEINDDSIKSEIKCHDVGATCPDDYNIKKTGYNFIWYEKYEIQFDTTDLKKLTTKIIPTKKVYITTTKSIDTQVGNRSIYYKAVYAPIQYTFIYSNTSNVPQYVKNKLNYDETIAPQIVDYDSKTYLKKHIDYKYLDFRGWTLTEGSEKIDFAENAEIYNYTTTDKKTYTLYPVYDTEKYQVLYNTLSGKYDNNLQQASEQYDFYLDEGMLIPKNMGTNKIFSHYIDMYGNNFTNLSDIREYVESDLDNNKTVILFAMSKNDPNNSGGISDSGNDDEKGNSDVNNNGGNSSGDNRNDDNSNGDNGNDDKDVNGTSDTENSVDNSNNNNNNNSDDNEKGNSGSNSNGGDNSDGGDNNNGDITNNDKENSNGTNNTENDKEKDNTLNNGGDGSGSTDSNENNNNRNGDVINGNGGNGGNNGNNNSSSTSSGSNSIRSNSGGNSSGGSSSGGNGGGSGGKGIVSNGSIINGQIVPNNESGNSNILTINAKEDQNIYLSPLDEKNTSSTKAKIKANSLKETLKKQTNKKDEEDDIKDELVYGPRLLYNEENANLILRGLHGPWYYEQDVIDRIMAERLKTEELINESIKEKQEKIELMTVLDIKTILAIAGGFIILILIIIYEIITIKQYRDRKKLECDIY